MMRGLFPAIWVSLAVSGCGTQPPADAPTEDPPPRKMAPLTAKELPKDWVLEEIVDAMPPRSDDGPTYILAWKVTEDNRPRRMRYCLGLKHLRTPTANQEKWVLASLVRGPASDPPVDRWAFETVWITPDPDFKNPPFIMYIKEYRERPTNAEIYAFVGEFRWAPGDQSDRLIDGGICAVWEQVIGEKPSLSFRQ